MLLICYQKNGLNLYTECNSMENFKNKLPGIHPTYVFDVANEIIYNIMMGVDEFNQHCGRYGFEPSDYNRTFHDKKQNYILKGFHPRNRKYKCIVYSPDNKQTYKMTPEHVHRLMEQ